MESVMTYSIIIPVYNSEASLKILYKQLIEAMGDKVYELIFINDSSTDSSLEILLGLMDLNDCVKVLHLNHNCGQQKALYYGLKQAKNEMLITLDDDLQHPITMISKMQKKIEKGADLVYAIPIDQHTKWHRQLGSKLTGLFFRTHFKQIGQKRVSSFRMFRRSLMDQVEDENYAFVYVSAILLPHAKHIENVHFESIQRPYGQSGYNLKKLLSLFLKLNFYYGYKFLKPFRATIKYEDERVIYEKDNDVRRWSMPVKCP